jgi:hypothetical protein
MRDELVGYTISCRAIHVIAEALALFDRPQASTQVCGCVGAAAGGAAPAGGLCWWPRPP